MRAYLELLRVEVTAFHRNLIRSSLWPCSSPYTQPHQLLVMASFGGRPLTVTLLYGVRTFLPPPHYTAASGCLACFGGYCSVDHTGAMKNYRGFYANLLCINSNVR